MREKSAILLRWHPDYVGILHDLKGELRVRQSVVPPILIGMKDIPGYEIPATLDDGVVEMLCYADTPDPSKPTPGCSCIFGSDSFTKEPELVCDRCVVKGPFYGEDGRLTLQEIFGKEPLPDTPGISLYQHYEYSLTHREIRKEIPTRPTFVGFR